METDVHAVTGSGEMMEFGRSDTPGRETPAVELNQTVEVSVVFMVDSAAPVNRDVRIALRLNSSPTTTPTITTRKPIISLRTSTA
jgi:hypothetical protein